MSAQPGFLAAAITQLSYVAANDETAVVATMSTKRMFMQTRTPRGPGDLVHIAIRLLEEVRDEFDAADTGTASAADDAAFHAACIQAALDELTKIDTPSADAVEG
jgi:hypothetical protein